MTRRGDGEATFEAEGATWRLRFDFNAMADFEQLTGKTAFAVLDAMARGDATATNIRALFWAALRQHQPEVTLEQAGRLVSAGLAAFQSSALSAMPSASDAAGVEADAEKPTAAASRAA